MSNRAFALKQEIFKCDPYENFDLLGFSFDGHGWMDNTETFEYLFNLIRPQTYVELGVWKGKSARWCAQKMKEMSIPDPMVIAIDTFEGSIEHWGGTLKAKTKLGGLQLKNGFPMFYFQFMANTILSNLQDVIVPFPTTSLTAVRYLVQHGVSAEIICIDASHQYPEVYNDLTACIPLLTDHNSIIIGDDLSPWFPDVGRSVKQFLSEHPEWKMIKDGFGFVLLQPGNDLDIKIPRKVKDKDAVKARKLAALNRRKGSDSSEVHK